MSLLAFTRACNKCMRPICTEWSFGRGQSCEDGDMWRVEFKSSQVGVVFEYHIREALTVLKVGQLVDGEIVDYLDVPPPGTKMHTFHFSHIWRLRHPESCDIFDAHGTNIRETVASYATALQLYGMDIVAGDFSVFPSIEKLVRRNSRNRFPNKVELEAVAKSLIAKFPSLKRFYPKDFSQ